MTPLVLWTIYDHPRDYPKDFVARKWEIYPTGARATTDILQSEDLSTLRGLLDQQGLCMLHRSPGDDPVIVETWL